MARPKVFIDWDYVGKLFEAGSTIVGAAAVIGINPTTLNLRCKRDLKMQLQDYRQMKLAKGNDQLRVKQFQLAMAGNTAMLIWLGKQRLGQSDKQQNQFIDADGNAYNPTPVINVHFKSVGDAADAENLENQNE